MSKRKMTPLPPLSHNVITLVLVSQVDSFNVVVDFSDSGSDDEDEVVLGGMAPQAAQANAVLETDAQPQQSGGLGAALRRSLGFGSKAKSLAAPPPPRAPRRKKKSHWRTSEAFFSLG